MILTSAIIVILVALWVSAAVHFIGAVFSARIRTQIATQPVLHGLWLFVALVLAAAVLWSSGTISTPPSKLVRAATNMAGLKTACESYRLTYDSFPSGDNAAITKALRGVNPRNIIFIELKSRNMNPAGEVIDPWGTPYRFKLENGKKPVVQSAGPDRVFETKDDLSSSSE
jgi:type II secretory pathway pseudopilin PulG